MNFDRLPKWAQQHITLLEREKETLQQRLNQWEGAKDTPISYWAGLKRHPIPNAPIQFELDDQYINVFRLLSDRGDKMMLRFHASRSVNIVPRATNSFILTVEN